MKRAVIDTNVLISSILSPEGTPARIMRLISDQKLQLVLCREILDEYKRVLAYNKLRIDPKIQDEAIAKITGLGIVTESVAGNRPMPDEDDRIFYDTARAAGAVLITGNLKHYPAEPFIMAPADFLLLHEGG